MSVWAHLDCELVRGDDNAPVIAALHGFGQRIRSNCLHRMLPNWRYCDFSAMSGLLDECQRRGWWCWMPQAPFRNWTRRHSHDIRGMIDECLRVTGVQRLPYLLGFSDGATVAASMLYRGALLPGVVVYSGIHPGVDPHPNSSRSLIVWNAGEKEALRFYGAQMHSEMSDTDTQTDCIVSSATRHEWQREMTNKILDWVAA